jgi:hypothetical protein
MEDFHQEVYSEEAPRKEAVSIRIRLQRMVSLLAPAQRLMLSIFLFLDVCIICFAGLFLFHKIALPF